MITFIPFEIVCGFIRIYKYSYWITFGTQENKLITFFYNLN